MIVLGADTHKRSHTIAGIGAATGEVLGERTVQVGRAGFLALLSWARDLDGDRVWALEDCRHVSGSLERFLIERGERVLRIPTNLMAETRKSSRQRGKSDGIDAVNVARAALREGLDTFPAAHLDGPELDLRLLVDHRERLRRATGRSAPAAGIARDSSIHSPTVKIMWPWGRRASPEMPHTVDLRSPHAQAQRVAHRSRPVRAARG
jgi:transposase